MMLYFNSPHKVFLILVYWVVWCSEPCKGQNDLPALASSIQSINSGSLMIPMENSLQSSSGYFNLYTYGLVNQLMQNNIPVKLAIRVGKLKDGIDFIVDAKRIRPGGQFPGWFDFKYGPYIIDDAYTNTANL